MPVSAVGIIEATHPSAFRSGWQRSSPCVPQRGGTGPWWVWLALGGSTGLLGGEGATGLHLSCRVPGDATPACLGTGGEPGRCGVGCPGFQEQPAGAGGAEEWARWGPGGTFPLPPASHCFRSTARRAFFFFSNFLVQVWSCPSHEPLMLTGCAPRSYWGQGCVWRWGWLRSAETPIRQDSQAGRPSLGRS